MNGAVSSFYARLRAELPVAAIAITLGALCLAYLVVPGLSNVTPLLACAFLLALLVQRLRIAPLTDAPAVRQKPIIARWRLLLFLFLEAVIFLGVWLLSRTSVPATPSFALTAARYAVLLPPLAMMPWTAWTRFARVYRYECVAVLIAMLTFYPHRLFMSAWPQYSQLLGRSVYFLARPYVGFLHYVPDATPTLVGPTLDTTILFGCNGLQAIKLFQMLFAFVLIVDWNALNRRRVLLGYAAGLAIALIANVVRIALLVVLGNRLSPDLVVRLHVGAGWMFFTAIFSASLWLSYGWLCGSSKTLASSHEHGRLQIARSTE